MTSRARYEVCPEGAEWLVKIEGEEGVESRHTSRESAIEKATELAKANLPSLVRVLRPDGSEETILRYGYDPDPQNYPGPKFFRT